MMQKRFRLISNIINSRKHGSLDIGLKKQLNPYTRRPDLIGFVIGPKDNAVPGATVYIYTAKVKEGTSPYCPSCYIDCGKKVTTDSNGFFKIQSLDPELTFRILTVCEGYEPVFVDDVARITADQGESAIPYYKEEGLIRCSGEKFETFSVDAHVNNRWQKGREEHFVWQDGRGVGLRKRCESSWDFGEYWQSCYWLVLRRCTLQHIHIRSQASR